MLCFELVLIYMKLIWENCNMYIFYNSNSNYSNYFQISNSNYLFQILKLHMVLFKLEMILANNKLFYTEKNNTNKSNTIKLLYIFYTINKPKTL